MRKLLKNVLLETTLKTIYHMSGPRLALYQDCSDYYDLSKIRQPESCHVMSHDLQRFIKGKRKTNNSVLKPSGTVLQYLVKSII